jgi:hypothetical protein
MAEIELAGAKISGGKMLLILPLLSALGGGLWAGFEFYKDYTTMKEQIQEYVSPDLSGLQEQLSVLDANMNKVQESVTEARDYTRDIKIDLKSDIERIEQIVDKTEQRVKDSEYEVRVQLADQTKEVRETETTVRQIVQDAETRFENKRDALQNDYDRIANDLRTANDTRVDTMKKDIDDKLSALNSKVERELKDTETRLNKRLQRALDNPLAN